MTKAPYNAKDTNAAEPMANPWIKKMIKTPVFSTGEGVETSVKNTKETCLMVNILLKINAYYEWLLYD